jgi:hypothetical protein
MSPPPLPIHLRRPPIQQPLPKQEDLEADAWFSEEEAAPCETFEYGEPGPAVAISTTAILGIGALFAMLALVTTIVF